MASSPAEVAKLPVVRELLAADCRELLAVQEELAEATREAARLERALEAEMEKVASLEADIRAAVVDSFGGESKLSKAEAKLSKAEAENEELRKVVAMERRKRRDTEAELWRVVAETNDKWTQTTASSHEVSPATGWWTRDGHYDPWKF